MAREISKAETIDYEQVSVLDAFKQMTGGRGPDACIDAVGMQAHGLGLIGAYDRVMGEMPIGSSLAPENFTRNEGLACGVGFDLQDVSNPRRSCPEISRRNCMVISIGLPNAFRLTICL